MAFLHLSIRIDKTRRKLFRVLIIIPAKSDGHLGVRDVTRSFEYRT